MNSIYFPNHDEEYYLKAGEQKNFEESKSWVNYFNQYFLTTISELFQKNTKRYHIFSNTQKTIFQNSC